MSDTRALIEGVYACVEAHDVTVDPLRIAAYDLIAALEAAEELNVSMKDIVRQYAEVASKAEARAEQWKQDALIYRAAVERGVLAFLDRPAVHTAIGSASLRALREMARAALAPTSETPT